MLLNPFKTFVDGLAELGINKHLIQNKKILADFMEKEQAYRDKDSETGDEEMVPESSDNEDGTEKASEYSEHQESENPDLEPEHILKKPQVQRFCLKEKVLATIATERMFTKEQ